MKRNHFSSQKEYSLDFSHQEDAEGCHSYAKKNEEAEWWSWEPAQSMCLLFANCTESGPPSGQICPNCVSGQKAWVYHGCIYIKTWGDSQCCRMMWEWLIFLVRDLILSAPIIGGLFFFFQLPTSRLSPAKEVWGSFCGFLQHGDGRGVHSDLQRKSSMQLVSYLTGAIDT